MPSAPSRIDAFWGGFFGIAPEQLQQRAVAVVPHAKLAGYSGAWFFAHEACCIVSAPPEWLPRLTARLPSMAWEFPPGSELLVDLFENRIERKVGPAYHGHLPPDAFRPVPCPEARVVASLDSAEAADFKAACDPVEWDESGLLDTTGPLIGYGREGKLCALAGLRRWSDDAGDPAVITRPDCRGQGCGTAVVSAVVSAALAAGKLLLYQTLESNAGAVGIAHRLGYEPYARHLAVRLHP